MTVKELIEELRKLPENLTVIIYNDESHEPFPFIEKYKFNTNYWNNDMKIGTIKAGEEFVKL